MPLLPPLGHRRREQDGHRRLRLRGRPLRASEQRDARCVVCPVGVNCIEVASRCSICRCSRDTGERTPTRPTSAAALAASTARRASAASETRAPPPASPAASTGRAGHAQQRDQGDGEQQTYLDGNRMECLPCNQGNATPLYVLGGALALVGLLGVVAAWRKRRTARRARRHRRRARRPRGGSGTQKHQAPQDPGQDPLLLLPDYDQGGRDLPGDLSAERRVDLEVFSFTNLELDALGLPLACVQLGGFENKLLFMILAPVGVLLCTNSSAGASAAATASEPCESDRCRAIDEDELRQAIWRLVLGRLRQSCTSSCRWHCV